MLIERINLLVSQLSTEPIISMLSVWQPAVIHIAEFEPQGTRVEVKLKPQMHIVLLEHCQHNDTT